MKAMKYAVVFEKTRNNYCAYLPDLPGCVATGRTRAQVERNIREAVAFHLDGMRQEGLAIPAPTAWTELVEAQV
jgi:predicted RNase H-like HicB family nuclease